MIDKELQALTEAYETERWDEDATALPRLHP